MAKVFAGVGLSFAAVVFVAQLAREIAPAFSVVGRWRSGQ
jgi:hypothetical protein